MICYICKKEILNKKERHYTTMGWTHRVCHEDAVRRLVKR